MERTVGVSIKQVVAAITSIRLAMVDRILFCWCAFLLHVCLCDGGSSVLTVVVVLNVPLPQLPKNNMIPL